MSIQSEITRIESAKTAIATAIAGKGVAVPEGTKLDGLAALVESIEAGGGCTITSGSFTPASDPTYGYTVTHGLGKIPELFVCWISQEFTGTVISHYLHGIYSNSLGINQYSSIYTDTVRISSSSGFNQITETTIHVVNTGVLTTKTYSWIAVG